MKIKVLPTLILDANPASAQLLAEQLGHAGFTSEVASTYPAATVAVRGKHYGTMILIEDPGDPENLSSIRDLRSQSPLTWLIYVSLAAPKSPRELTWRCGVDALLTMPYSVQDLAARLSAFALRSRKP